MLVNLEQKVGNVFIAVRHALETLDLVVDALGDGCCNPAYEVVLYFWLAVLHNWGSL